MFETVRDENKTLTACLLGIRRKGETTQEAEDHLSELESLVETMGVPITHKEIANVGEPSARLLVGTGRAEQVKANAEAREANLIIVDDDLTPAQQRNWEKLTKLAVIDRREVILDIFAQRAQTREARLQVELARLEYSLPRLKRAWTHLERQRGGGGFVGGAGEAQIEIDRRIVRDNIAKLKRELVTVRRQRATQRKNRLGKPVPTVALVGYTNAGKSSILNRLTGAGVLEEDKLFATLDPTTRRVALPSKQELVITDTVGFIRKLPHMLVDAFLSTLEEAQLSDMLVHVLDASHPNVRDHLRASNEVLKELSAYDKPTLYVFNKADLVEDLSTLAALRLEASPNVLTSTYTGQGMEELFGELEEFVARNLSIIDLSIPASRYDLITMLHREGHVLAEGYEDDQVLLRVDLPKKLHPRVSEFQRLANGSAE